MISLSPSAIVRKQARETLKGNYVAGVASVFLITAPIYILQGLNTVIDVLLMNLADSKQTLMLLEIVVLTPVSILTLVLLSPLFNGFVRMYYQAAFSGKLKMSDMFYYFSKGKYHNSLHLNLSFVIRNMLPAVLCFIPVFVYYFVCYSYLEEFTGTVLYTDYAFLLTLMSSILLILYMLKHFVVFTLYSSDFSTDVRELFRTSKQIMAAQKASAAKLFFSFTPWMLLCLLILPALYVIPYMTQSLCIGAKWMTMKGK